MPDSNTPALRQLRIGHTPDADDAFMFYGFVSGQVAIPGCEIVHELTTIDALNRRAWSEDPLEVTAISVHAFFSLRGRYELLGVGTSVGRGYGPRVLSRDLKSVDALAGKRIALPGPWTTATLAARLLLPPFEEVQMRFDQIIDAILSGEVDAGVIIHEEQLTFEERGLRLLCDLGAVFADRHDGLPLPLGVNCVRQDLDPELKRSIADSYRKSIQIAFAQREKAMEYSAPFGRGAPVDLLDRFVAMYVNDDCLAMNADVVHAVEILEKGYNAHSVKSPIL